MTTFIRVRDEKTGDIVGQYDSLPIVYEGMRVTQRIRRKHFKGTVTRVSMRSITVVYDDGMKMTVTFKRENGPCLPSPGTWIVHPWISYKREKSA
jgi:hypothetical protein